MIKQFLLFAIFSVCSICASAQKLSGSFYGLSQQRSAIIEINFSNASIHGMTEEDFAFYEQDWDKDMPTIVGKFVGNTAAYLDNVLIIKTSSKTPEYVIHVDVVSINTRGNYICDVEIVNLAGEVEATIQDLKAYGGTFGTKLNLIKDGAEHTGKALGNLLKHEIRRAKRSSK